VLVDSGRYPEALAAFRRALDSNPQHADAHNNYAFLSERDGRTAEALAHYKEALRLVPAHRIARYHLGRLLIATGRPREAVEHFRLLLEPEDVKTADVLYGLATAYVRLGDLGNALAYTRRARHLAAKYGRQDLAGRLDHDLKTLASRISP
jgi:tetratricopeptide (TPR) repeat protein